MSSVWHAPTRTIRMLDRSEPSSSLINAVRADRRPLIRRPYDEARLG
jgi:hypothetical protein